MKVLIQNTQTGQYLAHHGHWTASAVQAKDFRSSTYAYTVVRVERTPGLRVLFYYEELDYSVRAKRCYADYFGHGLPLVTLL